MTKLYKTIGLMSGTSMDGVDAALITTDGKEVIKTHGALTIPYSAGFRKTLRKYLGKKSVPQNISHEITHAHITAIKELLNQENLTSKEIDLIGFHGQTIYHNPQEKCSIQIGDPDLLAQETRIDVIFNLRQEDIKHGGQGAPLVPVFLAAITNTLQATLPIAFLNIGGVSNITYVDTDQQLIAFDMGPGNALMDDFLFSRTGKAFDKNGRCAAQGKALQSKISQFLADPYFDKPTPKSLDRNHFYKALESVENLETEDAMATLNQMTTQSIVKGCQHLPKMPALWVLCGGGRKNLTLQKNLEQEITNVISAEDIGLDGDALEAQAFGYLAVRSILNEPITFPSTTNVDQSRSGGELHPWNAS